MNQIMRLRLINRKFSVSLIAILSLGFLFFPNNLNSAQSCQIADAFWEPGQFQIGNSVNMTAIGTGCPNWNVVFNIWEDDYIGDDFVGTVNATFDSGGGGAITQWVINASQAGNESFYDFYFIAIAGEFEKKSSNLRVSGATTGPGPGGPVPGPGGPVPGKDIEVDFNILNPIAAESLIDLAKAIGRFLLQIAIPIAVIIIIYAGLLYLTSGGKPEQVKKATTAFKYALIGLAIILIGQGFFTLIKSILNLGAPGP